MGKWAGAYRAEKRRKEVGRIKNREEKEKRLAERRARQAEFDAEHPESAPGAPAGTAPVTDTVPAESTAATVEAGKKD